MSDFGHAGTMVYGFPPNEVAASLTLASGETLLAACIHDANTDPTATWNGTSMTRLGSFGQGTNGWVSRVTIFILPGATTGSHSVVFNAPSATRIAGIAFAYTSVDANATISNANATGNGSYNSSWSVSVSTSTGDLVLAVLGNRPATVNVTNGTQRNTQNVGGFYRMTILDRPASGTTQINGTLSVTEDHGITGIQLISSGGGGGGSNIAKLYSLLYD